VSADIVLGWDALPWLINTYSDIWLEAERYATIHIFMVDVVESDRPMAIPKAHPCTVAFDITVSFNQRS
jgi:hypothetical protein